MGVVTITKENFEAEVVGAKVPTRASTQSSAGTWRRGDERNAGQARNASANENAR